MQGREHPRRLTIEDLDPAFLEVGSMFTRSKPLLDGFLPFWKNVMRAIKQLRDRRPDNNKLAVMLEAKRLVMSNCIFALTMPELFG